MSNRAPQHSSSPKVTELRVPPPADYTDEVSSKQLKAIEKAVKDEKIEDWETIDGPIW